MRNLQENLMENLDQSFFSGTSDITHVSLDFGEQDTHSL